MGGLSSQILINPQAGALPLVSINRENIYFLFNNLQRLQTFGDKDEFLLNCLVSL